MKCPRSTPFPISTAVSLYSLLEHDLEGNSPSSCPCPRRLLHTWKRRLSFSAMYLLCTGVRKTISHFRTVRAALLSTFGPHATGRRLPTQVVHPLCCCVFYLISSCSRQNIQQQHVRSNIDYRCSGVCLQETHNQRVVVVLYKDCLRMYCCMAVMSGVQ